MIQKLLYRFYPMKVVDRATFEEWIASYPFQEDGDQGPFPSEKAVDMGVPYVLIAGVAVSLNGEEIFGWRGLAFDIFDRIVRGGFGRIRWRRRLTSETREDGCSAHSMRFAVSRELDIAEGREVAHV